MESGFSYKYESDISLFFIVSRLAVGPAQLPIQWIVGLFCISIKRRYILSSLLSESDIHQELSILKPNPVTWARHYDSVCTHSVIFSNIGTYH
jgi:hypothetical protein